MKIEPYKIKEKTSLNVNLLSLFIFEENKSYENNLLKNLS